MVDDNIFCLCDPYFVHHHNRNRHHHNLPQLPSWVTVVDTPGFGNTLQEEVIIRIFEKSLFSRSRRSQSESLKNNFFLFSEVILSIFEKSLCSHFINDVFNHAFIDNSTSQILDFLSGVLMKHSRNIIETKKMPPIPLLQT